MFDKLFDFSFRRTPLQALGWFLFFWLVAALIGFIAGALVAIYSLPAGTSDFSAGLHAGQSAGRYLGPIFPIVMSGFFLWARPLTAFDLIGALGTVIIGLFLGWMGAGIILAFLTTRPLKATDNVIPAIPSQSKK
jgi:hypothetical protein